MLKSDSTCTVVLVGDTKIGKTALINRLIKNSFLEDYTPTSFDKVVTKQKVDGKWIEFSLWDTSGCTAYDNVRSLPYEEADVFLLCFKISDPATLSSVQNKWMKELRRHRPNVPVVLCGCQSDLRRDPTTISNLSKTGRSPVTSEQALSICCEIDAVSYVETSSKEGESFSEVFEVCTHAALPKRKPRVSSGSKGHLNVSFSGSECEIREERGFHKRVLHHHPIIGCLRASQSQPIVQKDDEEDEEDIIRNRRILFLPPTASTSSSLVSPCCSEPPFILPGVRPNGLSRRTSFRSQRIVVPGNPPKSPVIDDEEDSFDPKSLPSSKTVSVQKKTYESLKSHTSTGSTESKTSSCSTSSLVNHIHLQRPNPPTSLSDSDVVVNTENPEILNRLNFVSPKTGVFRPINPVPQLNPKIGKKKQHCSLM